ncbi:DUF2303 family protein [Nevskia sp.]|uniref:DUF2303 family protein n=1 Tax=Nevskia sp. TaxID=1929292 RepID=UPI0025FF9CC6|nr:DUF2303 family protein [Nevskia sp.]
MEEENQSAAAIVRDLSRPTLQDVQGVPTLIIQDGQKFTQFPELLPRPKRTKAKLTAMDVGGFVDYVREYKLPRTRLFATTVGQALSITGKIDYHEAGEGDEAPSHCEHNITCPLTYSDEWGRWTGASNRHMSQKEFGEFLEENLPDIIEPQSDALLAAALNFSSSRKVEFRSSQRLSDGLTQFTYSESDNNAQQAALPTEIVVAIPVFVNGTKYDLKARLKHSIRDANLKIWYEIVRPDKVVELALKAVLADIAMKTGITPIRASVALA